MIKIDIRANFTKRGMKTEAKREKRRMGHQRHIAI